MRKATKTVISFAVILIAGLTITLTAFADPLSIGIGLPIAEATGIGLGITGLSPTGTDAWFNSSSGSDPVQLATNYVNVDLVNDVPIKYRKNNDSTVDFQIDKDSYIFQYFNNRDGQYTTGALHQFISNNNIVTGQTSQEILNSYSFNGAPFNTEVAVLPAGGSVHMPGGVLAETVQEGNFYSMRFTYAGQVQTTGTYADTDYPFYLSYVYHSQNYFRIRFNQHRYYNQLTGYFQCGSTDVLPSTINYGSGEDFVYDGDGDQYVHINIPENLLGTLVLSNPFGNLSGEDFIKLTEDLADTYVDGVKKLQVNSSYSDEDIGGDPPIPVPTTPLGEVPFDDWLDLWGQGIYQQLENQSDALDFIGSNGEDAIEELESIDSNLGDLNQTAEGIDTNIGIVNGLLGGIKSAAETAVDYLEGIAEHVEELVEEIVEGTETLIAGILNQIPTVFGIIFGPIKQASSIWHYVVEWIQSISAPMSWIWSMASGTSYNIILPVYASLAGAVVLAFYKRFGK